jgi:hypothetical protein
MIIEIIEEFLTVFVKGLAKKIGGTIRSVWYSEKNIYEETPESKWNFRSGIIVICLIFIGIVLVYF